MIYNLINRKSKNELSASKCKGSFFQPKYTVNKTDDVFEQEADSMADKVMRMKANGNESDFFKPAKISAVQRKCEHCEEEDKIQRKENSEDSLSSGKDLDGYIGNLNSGGNRLTNRAKDFFEPRFGYDFSNVKIHNDSVAAKSAQSINALAYTSGNNIVFSENQYSPETDSGKRLLAHELTHVIQQNPLTKSKNPNQVQRKPGDNHDLTAVDLSGDPVLEKTFDNEAIVGRSSNSFGEHVRRIQSALIQLGIELPLFGADGQFGSETEKGVKEFQEKAGMSESEFDGIVGRKTLGLLDMSLRDDLISSDTDKSENDFILKDKKKEVKDDSCKGKPDDEKCPNPNTKVNKGSDEALKRILKVIAEQLPPKKTDKADYPALFAQLFRNNDNRPVKDTADEVRKNYDLIFTFVNNLKTDPTHVRCGTDCDGGCRSGSPAYHQRAGGAHIITFCPAFESHPERISIVIHECHHAAIPGSKDIAYQHNRLIDKLDHKEALRNAASFHLYAALVEDPKSDFIGPKVKDKNNISDAKNKKNVDQSIAHIQQWFDLVTFDMSVVSRDMERANVNGSYAPKARVDLINDVYAKWFQVTPAPKKPKEEEVTKAKAIEERSVKMEKNFNNPFLINETAGPSEWERGPGKNLLLNQALMDLDVKHMVIALLQELVHATPDISAESEPLYVGTINDIRNTRKLSP